jgi:FlaA1/EpsC-like NDP-sugar epimerase
MEQQPYDYVLNFAAIKHVRSEKDVPSILQMLDTNVLKPARLLDWIAAQGRTRVYFCVSTDKAANPANLMGASKRLMEHVIFSEAGAPWPGKAVTSARFANVAFSAGSLLASWVQRLMNRQPLAVPEKTRRFFISCAEAGTICLLASLCIPDRYLLVPKLYPETDLQDLQSIAEDFLHLHNLEPHLYYDETDAKMGLKTDIAQGRYPLLITPLDTVGEKPHEKFVANGEKVTEVGLAGLLGVVYQPCNTDHLLRFLKDVQEWLDNPSASITKQVIIESISALLNDFIYIGSKKNLDERM